MLSWSNIFLGASQAARTARPIVTIWIFSFSRLYSRNPKFVMSFCPQSVTTFIAGYDTQLPMQSAAAFSNEFTMIWSWKGLYFIIFRRQAVHIRYYITRFLVDMTKLSLNNSNKTLDHHHFRLNDGVKLYGGWCFNGIVVFKGLTKVRFFTNCTLMPSTASIFFNPPATMGSQELSRKNCVAYAAQCLCCTKLS